MPTEADNGLEAALVARRKCAPSGNDDTFAIAHDDLHEADDACTQPVCRGLSWRVSDPGPVEIEGFCVNGRSTTCHASFK